MMIIEITAMNCVEIRANHAHHGLRKLRRVKQVPSLTDVLLPHGVEPQCSSNQQTLTSNAQKEKSCQP